MGFWRWAGRRSLSTATNIGDKYALTLLSNGRRWLMYNVRTGKSTYSDFPFQATHVVATCQGLALVQVSTPTEPHYTFVIGNPMTSRWKILPTPRFTEHRVPAGLARNPADNSVQLILQGFYDRCDRYDFKTDRWILGEKHDDIYLYSDFAWHKGSFFAFFNDPAHSSCDLPDEDIEESEVFTAELEKVKREIGDIGDESKFDMLYIPIDVSHYPECEEVLLFRCDVLAGELKWKQVELPSEVKRILHGWEVLRLVEDRGRLLIYFAYSEHDAKHPLQKRRQVQRMYELKDGKLVEDTAWTDAADDLDKTCSMRQGAWIKIGYGRRNEDFFWSELHSGLGEDRNLLRTIYLHSGVDGSVRQIHCPSNDYWLNFQSTGDSMEDEFLDVPAEDFKAWPKNELVPEYVSREWDKDGLSDYQRHSLRHSWKECKNDCRDILVHKRVCLGGKDVACPLLDIILNASKST